MSEPGYELVMPFVTVASNGGPHDDDAYTAGWEMGQLDSFLEHAKPPLHGQPIHADNAEQADLIGMKHGYRVTIRITEENPDWSWLELAPTEETP